MLIILILLLALFQVTMVDYLGNNPNYYQLEAYTTESDAFRSLKLGTNIISKKTIDYDMLTTLMIEHDYDLTKLDSTSYQNEGLLKRKPIEYQKLRHAYESIFTDLRYFPIPENQNPDAIPVTYEDGFGDIRTYGGERKHEGCDIMGNQKERGYYPVLSMSDGIVEQVGWLEQGGYRIGIRTPSGLYLYYAHLYRYAKEFEIGEAVTAGELLGFMGDSGYSKVEGAVGNFDVHLHVGIYIKTDHFEELSVNPYWVLQYLESNKLRYRY